MENDKFLNLCKEKIVEYFTKFYCDKTVTELIVPTKKTYDLFKEKNAFKPQRNNYYYSKIYIICNSTNHFIKYI